jgi:hypothetical protein
MITNQQLRDAFLIPQMQFYFERKLAPLPPAEVSVRIEEALKFLSLASHCNGDIPVSKEIDEVWHYWILETVEYHALCGKLYDDGSFLHHSSNDYALFTDPGAKNRKIERNIGVAILASYVMNFGPFTADRVRYWPFAARLMEILGWDLSQLNEWLAAAQCRAARPAKELCHDDSK